MESADQKPNPARLSPRLVEPDEELSADARAAIVRRTLDEHQAAIAKAIDRH